MREKLLKRQRLFCCYFSAENRFSELFPTCPLQRGASLGAVDKGREKKIFLPTHAVFILRSSLVD